MNLPLPKEKLHFKIGVSGSYWDKLPQFKCCINDCEIVNSAATGNIQHFEFDAEVIEDQTFTLDIWLLNKTDSDTVLDSDNNIIKDMLLNIESIEIDGIDLEFLKWSESEFIPQDPDRPILKNCINLGWNGFYRLTISSPFYLWLLEKM